MIRLSRRLAVAGLIASLAAPAFPAPAPPPGHNVHLVTEAGNSRFWRGGAPRKATLESLAAAARSRGVEVTLVDLRKPATADDRSGGGGRLSPQQEATEARRLGVRYLAISALDRSLTARLQDALRRGDVYMHCMYGVNRTGFATARYARSAGISVSREALGKRDWKQGEAFEARR